MDFEALTYLFLRGCSIDRFAWVRDLSLDTYLQVSTFRKQCDLQLSFEPGNSSLVLA
jgi:hypothetical protein